MAAMMSAVTLQLAWNGLQVYRALKSGVQVVAAKVFSERDPNSSSSSSSYAASRASAARSDVFKQEIAILKSCHDRNIVQFIGACLQPDCTIMVMEYLEGGDLYHAIANDSAGRFSWYKRWDHHLSHNHEADAYGCIDECHACCGLVLSLKPPWLGNVNQFCVAQCCLSQSCHGRNSNLWKHCTQVSSRIISYVAPV